MKQYFLDNNDYRMYAFFTIGINSALRISAILSLKYSNVLEKDHLEITEQKTMKHRSIPINYSMQQALNLLVQHENTCHQNLHLFRSRQSKTNLMPSCRVWQLMKQAATACGLSERIGTHSMRKTWAYHACMNEMRLPTISATLNHSSELQTLTYIGLTQSDFDKTYKMVEL